MTLSNHFGIESINLFTVTTGRVNKRIYYTSFKLFKRFTPYFVIPCLFSKVPINNSKNVFDNM